MTANLVLHRCPDPATAGALMWVAPADAVPADTNPCMALPAGYLDGGLVEVPNLADGTFRGGRLTIRCLEINPVVLDLHHNGGTRHLVVDLIDGGQRTRWRLNNATICGAGVDTPEGPVEWPVPNSALLQAVWVLYVDVDQQDVTRAVVPLDG